MKTYKKGIINQQLLSETRVFLKRILIIALLIMGTLLPLVVSGQTRNGNAPPPNRNEIVPLVDYHMHLLGPYALPMPKSLAP